MKTHLYEVLPLQNFGDNVYPICCVKEPHQIIDFFKETANRTRSFCKTPKPFGESACLYKDLRYTSFFPIQPSGIRTHSSAVSYLQSRSSVRCFRSNKSEFKHRFVSCLRMVMGLTASCSVSSNHKVDRRCIN